MLVLVFGRCKTTTCVDVRLLMHILKPECYVFVGFGFLKM